jgi:hypothetical protein
MKETLFLVAFFKFDNKGSAYGFERIHLQYIFKTEAAARDGISFCDEAGWYEGVLIEERAFGWEDSLFRGKRVWLIQEKDGSMKEFDEPKDYKCVIHLIG